MCLLTFHVHDSSPTLCHVHVTASWILGHVFKGETSPRYSISSVIAERLRARQLILHRISAGVCIYIYIYICMCHLRNAITVLGMSAQQGTHVIALENEYTA